MKKLRVGVGILLILHGLAHASAGMWATDIGGRTLVTLLWEAATLGFMAAGAGLIGLEVFHKYWKPLAVFASISSLALLLLYGHPLFIVGIAGDFAVMGAALLASRISRNLPIPGQTHLVVKLLVIGIMTYTGALIALRPWYSSWGTTRSERQMVMIGDPPLGESHYRIDHAITINAPVDSVWASLLPFGQGWKITQIEPGRAMVLENWGAFVVEPIDSSRTRLHIRTRGAGTPTVKGIALSPISLLTLEPAHFIMERGMLLGIKNRAEQASREIPFNSGVTPP
jgi:hypothetical protein